MIQDARDRNRTMEWAKPTSEKNESPALQGAMAAWGWGWGGVGLSSQRAQPVQMSEVGKGLHFISPEAQDQRLGGWVGSDRNGVIRCRVWVLRKQAQST